MNKIKLRYPLIFFLSFYLGYEVGVKPKTLNVVIEKSGDIIQGCNASENVQAVSIWDYKTKKPVCQKFEHYEWPKMEKGTDK